MSEVIPFRESLATVGETGTLVDENRGTYAQGRCTGKTGTLSDVVLIHGPVPLLSSCAISSPSASTIACDSGCSGQPARGDVWEGSRRVAQVVHRFVEGGGQACFGFGICRCFAWGGHDSVLVHGSARDARDG